MLVIQSESKIMVGRCLRIDTDHISAFTRFAESTLVNRVIAFRDIEPGEEINISCRVFCSSSKTGMSYANFSFHYIQI